jgi:cell wall-associated NlpC family hydrolase
MSNAIAATALSVRGHILRTPVRLARTLMVFAAFCVGILFATPQSAQAIPLPEVATSWIASTSRGIALELRASRSLPAREQRAVAGRQINEVAGLVAHLLSADADALRSVWAAASLTRKIAVFTALSQLGVPYRLNADAPFVALDCSALTKFAWAQAGLDIERGSQYQYARAARVTRDDVQAGDLVWYPGHIMLSLGLPELIVHARSGQRAVELHRIDATRLPWMRWVSPLQ